VTLHQQNKKEHHGMEHIEHIPTEKEVRQGTLGRFFCQKRQDARLTQRDVANKLGYTSPQFISNWERGLSQPPYDVLPEIAELYSIPPQEIIDIMAKYQEKVLARQKMLIAQIFEKRSAPMEEPANLAN
jgi:transcriptional regulator with XRE-family HTH domain